MDSKDSADSLPTILVVDDNSQNRKLVRAQLGASGYTVEEAESGSQALQLYEELRPDLVLLDVLMPGLDGFQTCTQIRQLAGGKDVAILFLTALNDLDAQEKALAAGGDDFLTKPIQRIELLIRVRSLTRIKSLQVELRNGYELILNQRNALSRTQRQKDELIALVVHDLKSPLASVSANLHYLQGLEGMDGEPREAIGDVATSVQAMQNLVMNLLDISRSEDGKLVPKVQDVDLSQVAQELHARLRQRLLQRNQSLRTHGRCEPVRGDLELLRRLLENLVDNCIKYSPPGGKIDIELRPSDPGFVEMRVRDQGSGIPAEWRERIFEKYVRLDPNGRAAAHRSMGLGLAFCRLAAEAHGGRIWVEDSAPRGSCFCVRLPASSARENQPEHSAAEPSAA